MRRRIKSIIAECSFLNMDSGEEIKHFLQGGYIFFFQLVHENLRRPGGVTSVLARVFDLRHPGLEIRFADMQTVAESNRIPLFSHVTNDHGYLVYRLVKNQQFAITVVYETAGRVDRLLDQSVTVRLIGSGLINDLQIEQTNYIRQNNHNGYAADHISASIMRVIDHLYFKALYPMMTEIVRRLLTTVSSITNPMYRQLQAAKRNTMP